MPYKMVGKRRVWVEEEAPQKTVQPAGLLAAQKAPSSRLGFDDFEKALGYSLTSGGGGKYAGTMNAIAQFGGNPGALKDTTYQYENANEGGTFMDTMQGKVLDPAFLDQLRSGGYSFELDKTGRHPAARMYDAQGNLLGRQFSVGDSGTKFDNFMEQAMPVALAALGGATFGGFIPGAEIGAAGAGGAGAGGAGGLIGAGEGAAQLAAYTAANPLTAAGVTASTLPAAGLPGLASTAGGLLGAGEGLAQLASYSAANPLTAAQVTASALPAGGLPGLAQTAGGLIGAGEGAAQMAASTAKPLTAAQVTASAIPDGGLPGLGAGGMLGQLPGFAGDAAAWMKANPQLGRLLMGGATSLLSGAGGGNSGGTQTPVGPPVQWNSGLQQGLLSPVQQYAPAAVQQNRPAGLLAQGYANDGAWRYLGG